MRNFALLLTITLLIGCTSPYHAKNSQGGYSETQLKPNSFEVRFQGNKSTDPEEAKDFALLRSAELTLEYGYSYFTISEKQDSIEEKIVIIPAKTETVTEEEVIADAKVNKEDIDVSIIGESETRAKFNKKKVIKTTTTHNKEKKITYKIPSTEQRIKLYKTEPRGMNSYNAALVKASLQKKYDLED